jgi:hypothetical protein
MCDGIGRRAATPECFSQVAPALRIVGRGFHGLDEQQLGPLPLAKLNGCQGLTRQLPASCYIFCRGSPLVQDRTTARQERDDAPDGKRDARMR